ncbi:hypothetical protein DFS34DRAFT_621048 [Phlyctochytrium arcticum]|nr:hypothetical protein DFS34DRAFT_621048 [Phlyctochytrium arcticum]
MPSTSNTIVESTLPDSLVWHTVTVERICSFLGVDTAQGLHSASVPDLLAKYGPNSIRTTRVLKWFHVLIRQFIDVMNWVFFALGAAAFVLGDIATGVIFCCLSVINIYLTFNEEYSAEKTLEALRGLSSPTCTVIRDGVESVIPATDAVPGDILVIKAGDKIAADCRLFLASGLQIDEALLTGESAPVTKNLDLLTNEIEPLGDRKNMAYSSTIVIKGRGMAIVVATGMQSEVGKIAKSLRDADAESGDKTHIQKALNKMYFALLGVAVLLVLIVLASNKFVVPYSVGMYALTAALSVLPAGLTTVLTVTLVLGGKEMTRQRALVRKLRCLETLGAVNAIFSDKTGTLTEAKMTVVRVWAPLSGHCILGSDGRIQRANAAGDEDDTLADEKVVPSGQLEVLIQCCALCNTAALIEPSPIKSVTPTPAVSSDSLAKQQQLSNESILSAAAPSTGGTPTELALQIFADRFNMAKPVLEAQGWTLIHEHHFDSTIKRMSVVYKMPNSDDLAVFVKGAAESVLQLCNNVDLVEVNSEIEKGASKGLRSMVLAFKHIPAAAVQQGWTGLQRSEAESELEFLGICEIQDPPRPESKGAVKQAHQAGITVHMLTGDHLATAIAIARQINVLPATFPAHFVNTGPAFDALSDAEIDALPTLPLVVARCSPETKVRMIRAAKRRGMISAMTGDGVNDSPSLKIADVGIAMGLNGSDVAKQASDMILTDDNFATIIRAIKEGRRIYRNIQRFLLYYWIGLAAGAIAIIVNLWMKDLDNEPIAPLTTVQLLILAIVMAPPAASLSKQPAAPGLMREPPRPSSESLFNKEITMDMIFYTSLTILCLLLPFYMVLLALAPDGFAGRGCDFLYTDECAPLQSARTVFMAIFTFTLAIQAIHCRSFRDTEFFSVAGLRTTAKNYLWIGSCLVGVLYLVLFSEVPGIARNVGMRPLGWEWGLIVGVVVLYLFVGELYKAGKRRWMKVPQGQIVLHEAHSEMEMGTAAGLP